MFSIFERVYVLFLFLNQMDYNIVSIPVLLPLLPYDDKKVKMKKKMDLVDFDPVGFNGDESGIVSYCKLLLITTLINKYFLTVRLVQNVHVRYVSSFTNYHIKQRAVKNITFFVDLFK